MPLARMEFAKMIDTAALVRDDLRAAMQGHTEDCDCVDCIFLRSLEDRIYIWVQMQREGDTI